jgi:hypothetical protein
MEKEVTNTDRERYLVKVLAVYPAVSAEMSLTLIFRQLLG